MRLEDEHCLVWQVDRRWTSDVGLCSCGWTLWSRYRDEIKEAHGQHLDYMRRKQAAADLHAWAIECQQHTIRWNECHDGAGCSRCQWSAFDGSTAKILVSWNAHLEGLKKGSE